MSGKGVRVANGENVSREGECEDGERESESGES